MLTLIALHLLQSQDALESAWQEARTPCKDKGYVSFDVEYGGMGSVHRVYGTLAKDGRVVLGVREEVPARELGGTTRFPMVVTKNAVFVCDGKSWTLYDSLKEATQNGVAVPEDAFAYRGLAMFWLDKRDGKNKLVAKEDFEMGGSYPGKYRRFTLTTPDAEINRQIAVRLSDGFVVQDTLVPSKTDEGAAVAGSGQQAATPMIGGQYWTREPGDLAWKPPVQSRKG